MCLWVYNRKTNSQINVHANNRTSVNFLNVHVSIYLTFEFREHFLLVVVYVKRSVFSLNSPGIVRNIKHFKLYNLIFSLINKSENRTTIFLMKILITHVTCLWQKSEVLCD